METKGYHKNTYESLRLTSTVGADVIPYRAGHRHCAARGAGITVRSGGAVRCCSQYRSCNPIRLDYNP